jgi:ribonuclease T2
MKTLIFSYYMLALSYAPNFCAQPGVNRDPRECGVGAPAFVVHGLWPQNENGRGPRDCGAAKPVAADIVRSMLKYMPNEGLIEHEWKTHGTCSGLSPADYFAAVRRLADSLRIPPEFTDVRSLAKVTPERIENAFASLNSGIPRDGFRVACYPDNGLEELRVCFDKSYNARACTGVPDCTKVNVILRPTRPRR